MFFSFLADKTGKAAANYEAIAALFLDICEVVSTKIRDEHDDELEQITAQFGLIKDELDSSASLGTAVIITADRAPQLLIEKAIGEVGNSISVFGLMGLVIKCLDETLPLIVLAILRHRLREIANEHEPKIYVAKKPVIELYIIKTFLLMASDYWTELGELNSFPENVNSINIGDRCLLYPSQEKYLRIAYVAGHFFATALVRHYLEQVLRNR
jgi:hypothetical protein